MTRLPVFAALLLSACALPATPPALPPVTKPSAPATTDTQTPPSQAVRDRPATILVSIDGFRPDYLHHGDTPHLDAIAAAGVSGSMYPSFPSITFPNHYTLVTGLRPDRNGIVSNTMEDPAKPGALFQLSDSKVTHDPDWWNEAEPLWVTAERAGILSGTMFWPGSDLPIRGVRPHDWILYDADYTGAQRVRTVLDWLRRPAGERPGFITLYFDTVDKTSHHDGFYAPQKTAAIRDVDAQIGVLQAGLAEIGRPVNLVIVSDHGMAPVPIDQRIDPASVAPPATTRTLGWGPLVGVYPRNGVDPRTLDASVGRHAHDQCWRRESLPARFHYGRNPRVAPVICLADTGWSFADRPADYVRGDHGYDPRDPAMRALFLAQGPAFRSGRRLAPFDNVDVAPLLRDLIGLPPGQGLDGTDRTFRAVLRPERLDR